MSRLLSLFLAIDNLALPGPTTTSEISKKADYHLAEFNSLRSEIVTLSAELRALERYALIAITAIYTWLFTQDPGIGKMLGLSRQTLALTNLASTPLPNLVIGAIWFLPIAIVYFCLDRTRQGYNAIKQAVDYLLLIEKKYMQLGGKDVSEPAGWEHYLVRVRAGRDLSSWRFNSTIFLWYITLSVTAVLFCWRIVSL